MKVEGGNEYATTKQNLATVCILMKKSLRHKCTNYNVWLIIINYTSHFHNYKLETLVYERNRQSTDRKPGVWVFCPESTFTCCTAGQVKRANCTCHVLLLESCEKTWLNVHVLFIVSGIKNGTEAQHTVTGYPD